MILTPLISIQANTCSIQSSYNPKCYIARSNTELNIALIHYGNYISKSRLLEIGQILEDRFKLATQNHITVNISDYKIIPLKHTLPPKYQNNGITDKKRLRRLWYYDNKGAKVILEAYEEFKKQSELALLNNLDALLVISEAQFNGLGFASGRIGITENPMEVAWNASDQGKTIDRTNYQIVDELIHELGHIMFLGHTSIQCFKKEMNYQEQRACCKISPSQNDVLSYCRDRKRLDQNFYHKFESCNLDMIQKLVAPAIKNGGQWNITGRKTCL